MMTRQERDEKGELAELVGVECFFHKIIPNLGFSHMREENYPELIKVDLYAKYNCKYGDLIYVDYDNFNNQYVDIKGGFWVSKSSLDFFVMGGIYMIDCINTSPLYLLRKNQGLLNWISSQSMDKGGYNLIINKMRSSGYEPDLIPISKINNDAFMRIRSHVLSGTYNREEFGKELEFIREKQTTDLRV